MVQNYGRKIVHRVMKAKRINVGKTKIGKLLSEIKPQAQPKRQNVVDRSLNPKVYIAKSLLARFIAIKMRNREYFELFMCVVEMGFPVKWLGMLK